MHYSGGLAVQYITWWSSNTVHYSGLAIWYTTAIQYISLPGGSSAIQNTTVYTVQDSVSSYSGDLVVYRRKELICHSWNENCFCYVYL